ncbi:FG-GAP-like repeat-containing protein [Nocardioides montaniterrae]
MSEYATPPGWYPDGAGWERRWDGTSWTADRRPIAPLGPPPSSPPPSSPPPSAPPSSPPSSYGHVPSVGVPQRPAYAPATPSYAAPQGPPPSGRRGKGPIALFIALGAVLLLVVAGAIVLVAVHPWSKDPQRHDTKKADPKGGLVRGDLNGDGLGDVRVVIADDYDSYRQVTGTSDGTRFQLATIGATPSYNHNTPATIDFNGDGTPDQIDYTYDDDSQQLSLSSTSPGFGIASSMAVPFSSLREYGDPDVTVAGGDFDGDGSDDLVVYGQHNRTIDAYVLLGHGDGTFDSPTRWISIPNAMTTEGEIAVGDFNGDGKTDLWGVQPIGTLTAKDYREGYVVGEDGSSIFASDGKSFGPPHLVPLPEESHLGYARNLLTGDVTGKGHDSLVVLEGDSYYKTLTVTAYDVSTGAAKPESGMTVVDKSIGDRDVQGASLSDVDGDGDADVVYLAKGLRQAKFFGFRVIISDGNRLNPSTGWGDVAPCTGDACRLVSMQ